MQKQIYTSSGHSPCLRPIPKQPAWDFHYPCIILYKQWTTKESPPLCSVITTKKLCPLLAMNPKERWSLVSSDNNQEFVPTSCNKHKRRWYFVSSDQPRSKFYFLQWTQVTLVPCVQCSTKKTFFWKQSPRLGFLKSFL